MIDLSETEALSLERFREMAGGLGEAEGLLKGKACVYATGSLGRLEANEHSDLDLFIVGKVAEEKDRQRLLSRLDEICVKADIIRAARKLQLPELDGDGKYLVYHSVRDLIDGIGGTHDDVNNTLTARLLLFLESRPLLGEDIYDEIIRDVIEAYWRDFDRHKSEFIPAYLANDILRLWRTFCVNYEARTQTEPESKKIDRKIKNFKLKHSRILTCFSALALLLKYYKDTGTVTSADAFAMTQLTPLRRMEFIAESTENSRKIVSQLMDQYAAFLVHVSGGDEHLRERFGDDAKAERLRKESQRFGELMFETLRGIGEGTPFYRLLVV